MTIYQQTATMFSSSPTPPTKTVESPVVVSYAYVILLSARRAIYYVGVIAPKVPLNKIYVLYQDFA